MLASALLTAKILDFALDMMPFRMRLTDGAPNFSDSHAFMATFIGEHGPA
ncbi:hypothetical protein [Variibacter gotjawalensis]|nr:hypothetical protein [Variibacter gotjawalensis]NIK49835.1 hypothetical protein [Variibacter gotjawalensis]